MVRVGLLEEPKCKLRPEGRERGSPIRGRERDFQVKRVTFAKCSAQQRAGKHICDHSHTIGAHMYDYIMSGFALALT